MDRQDQTPPPQEDALASQLRGFGPVGILAIVVILMGNAVVTPLSAVLVLIWARLSRTPWRELGYERPRRWLATIVAGILLGVTLKLVMKAIVMPLLGAPPVNQAFHYLAGNPAAIPATLYLMIVGAGFGEETVFRGFAFERLGKLIGHGRAAMTATVLVTSAWFGIIHYPFQGVPGAQQATLVGLLFGTIFAVTRRLWLLICAHAAFDLTAYAIIYWDLETTVAHLVFK